MSFLVTVSNTQMLLDTMPALKLTCWQGNPKRDTVYSYGKLYLHQDDLVLGGWIFDGHPPKEQCFCAAFHFSQKNNDFLSYTVSPQGEARLLLHQEKSSILCETPVPQIATGCDEQGEYWSFEAVLPASLLNSLQIVLPKAGGIFSGNLFLFDRTETAFGSAFAVPHGSTVPTDIGFGSFVAVPY